MALAGLFVGFASIALALTGFVGLIAVYRGRRQKWSPVEIQGLRILLVTSIAAMLFGLLPVPFLLAGVGATLTWALCLFLLGGFLLFFGIVVPLALHRERIGPRGALFWSIIAGQILVGALTWIAAAGIGLAQPAIYALGLAWLLLVAALQFMVQIVRMIDPADRGTD